MDGTDDDALGTGGRAGPGTHIGSVRRTNPSYARRVFLRIVLRFALDHPRRADAARAWRMRSVLRHRPVRQWVRAGPDAGVLLVVANDYPDGDRTLTPGNGNRAGCRRRCDHG